jgi:hypothetical protein
MYTLVHNFYKGRSIVATTNIRKDTIILKERPILLAEDVYDALYQIYHDEDSSPDEIQQELIDKFESLAPDTLDKMIITTEDIQQELETIPQYMREFLNNMIHNNSTNFRILVAKFYRNAFRYTLSSTASVSPSAILIEGALLNHSCCNNVDFMISPHGEFIFTTNRDIYEGEELCDTYIDTTLSTKKRQIQLQSQYGFTCTCEKCQN